MIDTPKKPVVHDHTEVRIAEHAAYSITVLKDADGKFWKFQGAAFYFDMKQIDDPLAFDPDKFDKRRQRESQ